jgi:molybdopterin-guanine dinucleotide biosynthesis protein A
MRNRIKASGAILIGGTGSRFGSDKATLTLDGEYITTILYNRLKTLFTEVSFVSNQQHNLHGIGVKYLVDIIPKKGTLGGLYTALKFSREQYCFVTACDLPFIDVDLIQILWSQSNGEDIITPSWFNNLEPLATFYHKNCLTAIEEVFHIDEKMVKSFWNRVKVKLVDMTKYYNRTQLEKIFLNINTIQEYKRAIDLMKSRNFSKK